MPVDSALLDRLEALLASATAGPWILCDFGGPVVCDCALDDKWDESGIAMPVSAPSDVPLPSAADAQLIVNAAKYCRGADCSGEGRTGEEKSMKPRRQPRTPKRSDLWPAWRAKGYTLPSDAELERLSRPNAVASAGSRLVPITTTETEDNTP